MKIRTFEVLRGQHFIFLQEIKRNDCRESYETLHAWQWLDLWCSAAAPPPFMIIFLIRNQSNLFHEECNQITTPNNRAPLHSLDRWKHCSFNHIHNILQLWIHWNITGLRSLFQKKPHTSLNSLCTHSPPARQNGVAFTSLEQSIQ